MKECRKACRKEWILISKQIQLAFDALWTNEMEIYLITGDDKDYTWREIPVILKVTGVLQISSYI